MLIDFTVENFRSFGSEQTLNLVASNAQKGHEEHCVDIPGVAGERVLRASVIYGANASGKSNLVKAMDFARDLIVQGLGPMEQIALNQFRFTDVPDRPSSFQFRFFVENRVFTYGFAITRDEVTQEWLSATSHHGREVDVFHRKGKNVDFDNLNKLEGETSASRDALNALKILGVRSNQLLLTKIFDLDEERRGSLLSQVVDWFNRCLTITLPEPSFGPIIHYLDEDPDFAHFAAEFLRSVGTGIGGLSIERTYHATDELPRSLVRQLQTSDDLGGIAPMAIGPGTSLHLDPDDPDKAVRRNLASKHTIGDRSYSLPFEEESDGTQRFLNLLPTLFHLRTQRKVFVIDELDRSLHPLLSHVLLRFFVDSCPGENQQLIVTTHETHLLDQELLRRDEIWFTEKDDEQQTQLVPLTDMKIRKDLRLEKSYLQGRFGAIPFIGGLDKLKDLIGCPG